MRLSAGKLLARSGLSAALLAAVVALGQVPWGATSDEAVLRVALRTVRGKLEICRELTVEEKDSRPIHMQGAMECDSQPITYRLRLIMNGEAEFEQLIEPGGLRKDRPHNFDREFVFAPGSARLEVLFTPEMPADATREMRQAFSELPTYELRRPVLLKADRVTLIYLDDTTGGLEVIGP